LGERAIAAMSAGLWLLSLPCSRIDAIELHSDLTVLGQVRDGDQSRETEVPVDLYGDLGLADIRHGATVDTYFRLEQDFARNEGATDFYQGSMRVPAAIRGVDFTLGRQFLSEVPGGAYVADGGKLRLDPGGPVAFTVFGGQPRYFEPTYSAERLSQDEQLFGGSVRTSRWRNASLALGYLRQEREGRTLRQLLTGTATRSFPMVPGLPSAYGGVAYDADHQNLDMGNAGLNVFLLRPRLMANFEGGYYRPQDHGLRVTPDINRREDAIFEIFSVSQLLQFRGGLRYALTRTLSTYGDYSYQRYEQLADLFVNGHVASAGVLWLPGGDGLEVVRLEYYLADSRGGTVNGGNFSYESRVYERLLFRAKVDAAYYEKESNQRDTAVTGLMGVGYALRPGLVAEVSIEGNRNKRFDDELRFGFFITYNFRYRAREPQAGLSDVRAGRPRPWGPATFGPASWEPPTWRPEP
jgi:hypothetical protein